METNYPLLVTLKPKRPIVAWIRRLLMSAEQRKRHDALRHAVERAMMRKTLQDVEEQIFGC